MLGAAEQDAAQRADVAVVAAPGQRHVRASDDDVVGRIEIDPAVTRAVDRRATRARRRRRRGAAGRAAGR